MRITEIGPRDLPRMSAREAAVATRAARVLAGMAARIEVPLGELGTIALARGDIETFVGAGELASAVEAGGDVALGLSRGAVEGRLLIDGALARRALALVLGVEPAAGAPLARVGLASRGVVAGLVASVLHATQAPFSVALVAPGAGAVAREGGVAFNVQAVFGGTEGWVRLELPASWLVALAPSGAPAALVALEVEARAELARTRLSAVELAGLVVGDAVVFEGERALGWDLAGSGASRPVRVVVGAHATRARLASDGLVTLEDELWSSSAASSRDDRGRRVLEEVTMEKRSGDEKTTRTVDVAAVLAAAPIEVVAELGRVVLRGEEVAGLGPGAVLAFGRIGASPVALRVGGEVWAEGELVDVEGELGVRVTTLRRGA
jgi:type III secretion system YscQ/HrcQ family protein